MATQTRPVATIDLMPNHCAVLEPALPEVWERLLRRVVRCGSGGEVGHTVKAAECDQFSEDGYRNRYDAAAGRVERVAVQRVPQGLVAEVAGWLAELGYTVEVRDGREDSPRWVRATDWRAAVGPRLRRVVTAVGRERALRVVAGGADAVADAIAAVTRAYPAARVAVAVPTHRLLWRLWGRLRARVRAEPLGLYTSKTRRPGRVAVGLIRQLPVAARGEVDLLVLPFAAQTVGDEALRVVTTERFRRVLSFTPFRWSHDTNLDRRLQVVAGAVFPPAPPRVPVVAVVLAVHGTRPASRLTDPLDAKRRLYTRNARRNRRVAEVARRLGLGTLKAVRGLGVGDPHLLEQVVAAARAGVAVLVETPAHARALAAILPGWAVRTAGGHDAPEPEPGGGVIQTELAAAESGVEAGVLIRATGTAWGLPDLGWPRVGSVEAGILVDFEDAYHPVARRQARERADGYRRAGMTVWSAGATASAETGA